MLQIGNSTIVGFETHAGPLGRHWYSCDESTYPYLTEALKVTDGAWVPEALANGSLTVKNAAFYITPDGFYFAMINGDVIDSVWRDGSFDGMDMMRVRFEGGNFAGSLFIDSVFVDGYYVVDGAHTWANSEWIDGWWWDRKAKQYVSEETPPFAIDTFKENQELMRKLVPQDLDPRLIMDDDDTRQSVKLSDRKAQIQVTKEMQDIADTIIYSIADHRDEFVNIQRNRPKNLFHIVVKDKSGKYIPVNVDIVRVNNLTQEAKGTAALTYKIYGKLYMRLFLTKDMINHLLVPAIYDNIYSLLIHELVHAVDPKLPEESVNPSGFKSVDPNLTEQDNVNRLMHLDNLKPFDEAYYSDLIEQNAYIGSYVDLLKNKYRKERLNWAQIQEKLRNWKPTQVWEHIYIKEPQIWKRYMAFLYKEMKAEFDVPKEENWNKNIVDVERTAQ